MRSPAWVFWVYLVATVPWAGCLIFYGLRSPWWLSPTGRAQITTYASLTVVLGFATVLRLFQFPHPALVAVVLVCLGGVCAAGVWQLTNVLRIQQKFRRDRDGT